MPNFILTAARIPFTIIKKLYDWTIHWARDKKAPYALFGIAFMESSFFPVPPDVLLIPMVMSDRTKWFRYALICTVGSVVGGLFGYAIGWGLFEIIGKHVVALYGLEQTIHIIEQQYRNNAFFTIFTAAFTPIPYKAITITAGLFSIPLWTLIIASILGRAGRFFIVAGALRIFGKQIQDSIEKYFNIISIIFVVLLIGGFVAFKFLFK